MTQLLERARPRRLFSRMDILAQLGETICLEVEPPAPARREFLARVPTPAPHPVIDEDPERWDGLS